jgi:hypothetical protein
VYLKMAYLPMLIPGFTIVLRAPVASHFALVSVDTPTAVSYVS